MESPTLLICYWVIITAHIHYEIKYHDHDGFYSRMMPRWYIANLLVLGYGFVWIYVDPGYYDILFYIGSFFIWIFFDVLRDRSFPRWYSVSVPISSLYILFFMYPYPGPLPEQLFFILVFCLWWMLDWD